MDLDDLSATNFANPNPQKMYTRFKRWVATAWDAIQTEQQDWAMNQNIGVAFLFPRITVSNVVGSFFIGDILLDENLNTVGTIANILLSPDNATTYIDLTDVEEMPGPLGITLSNAAGSTCTMVYQAEYPVRWLASDMDAINLKPMYLENANFEAAIIFLPWEIFATRRRMFWTLGYRAYTINPRRCLEFTQNFTEPFNISFTYNRTNYSMINAQDVPVRLPSQYHMLIVWKALMYYADYDRDMNLRSRAEKEFHKLFVMSDINMGKMPAFGGPGYGR